MKAARASEKGELAHSGKAAQPGQSIYARTAQISEDTESTGRSGSPCQKAAINMEMWKEREMWGDPCALGLVLKVLVSSQGFFR